jgi:hypothetical protein
MQRASSTSLPSCLSRKSQQFFLAPAVTADLRTVHTISRFVVGRPTQTSELQIVNKRNLINSVISLNRCITGTNIEITELN